MQDLPDIVAYNSALLDPVTAFTDSELRRAKVHTNSFGLPWVAAGGFAATYRLTTDRGEEAVRCFHRDTPGLEARYRLISRSLQSVPCQHLLWFSFESEGIRVDQKAFPIVRMKWARGEVLNVVLQRRHREEALMRRLLIQVIMMARQLRSLGIAHGDLQTDNLVWDEQDRVLRMVDYDGMYVPEMKPGNGTELGKPDFQHPKRTAADFGPAIDRFSMIVLAISLAAIMEHPELYAKYAVTGENILFTATDYANPSLSAVFAELAKKSPAWKYRMLQFARVCAGSTANVPDLDEFLKPGSSSGIVPDSKSAGDDRPGGRTSFPVLAPSEVGRAVPLLAFGGDVFVVGKVLRSRINKKGTTLHFADRHESAITVTLVGSAAAAYEAGRGDNTNPFVAVRGVVVGAERKRSISNQGGACLVSVELSNPRAVRLVSEREASGMLDAARRQDSSFNGDEGSAHGPRPPPESGELLPDQAAQRNGTSVVESPLLSEAVPRANRASAWTYLWSVVGLAAVSGIVVFLVIRG